ncbi:MAG: hypothetical protein QM582_02060 [Micropruina sp.]|uniref:hypothetical protein n=1 Tax=Micropruina sp. TaxID=2737536 RepID=UPI0039E5E354
MSILQRLRLPSWGPYVAVAALAMAGLLPLLARLPKVAVVACFDAGHPLYTLVPSSGAVHCVTAPAPVVNWTLMVAAALLVHLVLVPAALLAAGVLLAGARRLVGIGRGVLAAALAWLDGVTVPAWPQPAPAPVPVLATRPGWSRVNPRRGPPTLS